MYAAIVIIMIVALAAEYAMTFLENRLAKWRPAPLQEIASGATRTRGRCRDSRNGPAARADRAASFVRLTGQLAVTFVPDLR